MSKTSSRWCVMMWLTISVGTFRELVTGKAVIMNMSCQCILVCFTQMPLYKIILRICYPDALSEWESSRNEKRHRLASWFPDSAAFYKRVSFLPQQARPLLLVLELGRTLLLRMTWRSVYHTRRQDGPQRTVLIKCLQGAFVSLLN